MNSKSYCNRNSADCSSCNGLSLNMLLIKKLLGFALDSSKLGGACMLLSTGTGGLICATCVFNFENNIFMSIIVMSVIINKLRVKWMIYLLDNQLKINLLMSQRLLRYKRLMRISPLRSVLLARLGAQGTTPLKKQQTCSSWLSLIAQTTPSKTTLKNGLPF